VVHDVGLARRAAVRIGALVAKAGRVTDGLRNLVGWADDLDAILPRTTRLGGLPRAGGRGGVLRPGPRPGPPGRPPSGAASRSPTATTAGRPPWPSPA